MKPEDIVEAIEEMGPYLATHTEVQLADYGETANGGPYLKFRLADADELDPFRGQDRAAKNKAGKRYIMMLIEVGDDERPVDQKKTKEAERVKGGPLSKRAAFLCLDPDFQAFVKSSVSPETWRTIYVGMSDEQAAREYILRACDIKSRAELDHNARAAHMFQRGILGPFIREVA